MWNMTGDGATHLAWTKDLISLGHIPETLFYPFLHLFLADIQYISDLNLEVIHKIVPVYFGILFLPFMYLFSRSVFPRHHIGPFFVVALSCGFLIPSTLLAPNLNSYLMFPLFLFIYIQAQKTKRNVYVLLLALSLITLTIFHPISAFIFGLIISSILIISKISNKFPVPIDFSKYSNDRINTYSIIFIGIFYFLWLTQFWYFGTTLNSMYESTISGADQQYAVIGQAIDNAQSVGNDPLIEIIKRFGQQILFLIIALAGLIQAFYKRNDVNAPRRLLLWSFPFFAIIIFMVFIIGASGFTIATRYLNYILILGTLFCSYLLIRSLNNGSIKKGSHSIVAITLVIVVLCSITTMGVLDAYPSPYNGKTSYHTTKASVNSMSWFLEHRDVKTPLTGISIAPGRYVDLLLPIDERQNQNLPYYMHISSRGSGVDRRPPFHFGYQNVMSLGEFYQQETDMITTLGDVQYYSFVRPELASTDWNQDDFNKLALDSSVNKISFNGEYTVWKIFPD